MLSTISKNIVVNYKNNRKCMDYMIQQLLTVRFCDTSSIAVNSTLTLPATSVEPNALLSCVSFSSCTIFSATGSYIQNFKNNMHACVIFNINKHTLFSQHISRAKSLKSQAATFSSAHLARLIKSPPQYRVA